jgi:hypothetical protein
VAWHSPKSTIAPALLLPAARSACTVPVSLHNHIVNTKKGSQALAQCLPMSVIRSYRTTADRTNVPAPLFTLHTPPTT